MVSLLLLESFTDCSFVSIRNCYILLVIEDCVLILDKDRISFGDLFIDIDVLYWDCFLYH